MCGLSIHSSVYSVIGVWGALSVQEGNTTFIVWKLHSELYMVIHIINIVEQDVHLVLFSYADYIIHISLPSRVVLVLVLHNIPCKYLLWLVRLENPLLLP